MKNAIDPFTVEVIRHALTAAAEEMSFVVMRSARSPLLREAGDLSSAITDHKGGLYTWTSSEVKVETELKPMLGDAWLKGPNYLV